MTEGLEFESIRVKNSLHASHTGSGAPIQPPIQWVPEVKQQGHEADRSPPTSAKVKKMWIYTSTPAYAFMA
jgi:hypothetical protein